jgi:hypothetical protein
MPMLLHVCGHLQVIENSRTTDATAVVLRHQRWCFSTSVRLCADRRETENASSVLYTPNPPLRIARFANQKEKKAEERTVEAPFFV